MSDSQTKPRVLFLCTGNSCRSQMAEALLRYEAGGLWDACSAGLEPKSVHPMTLQVLEEAGVSTDGLYAKGTSEFLGKKSIRYAIVVCDKAQQSCPRIYPFAHNMLYWPFEDPALAEGSDEHKLARFRAVRDHIHQKIKEWIRTLSPIA